MNKDAFLKEKINDLIDDLVICDDYIFRSHREIDAFNEEIERIRGELTEAIHCRKVASSTLKESQEEKKDYKRALDELLEMKNKK